MKTLDTKLAKIRSSKYTPKDFIIADANQSEDQRMFQKAVAFEVQSFEQRRRGRVLTDATQRRSRFAPHAGRVAGHA